MLGIDYSILHFLEPTLTNRFMAEGEGSDDYTKVTITTIVFVSIIIMVYFFLTDIGQRVSEKSGSFTNSSELALLYRMVCTGFCVYAIIYMFRSGPANMHVVLLEGNEDILLHPVGIHKFVTFSSWTLLACTGYFLLSSINQIQLIFASTTTTWLGSLQTILFCMGISMAFLTATVVRYIILPSMVENNNSHSHMFLYHEQIMHNFAGVFLAFDLLLVRPDLAAEFAIFGLLIGIVYISFAYALAYFGPGYFVYSFLHPQPKIAPIFATGLALCIALFYLGLWLITQLGESLLWLQLVIIVVWLSLIIQFRSSESNSAVN